MCCSVNVVSTLNLVSKYLFKPNKFNAEEKRRPTAANATLK